MAPEASPDKPFELDDLFDAFPHEPDDHPTRWSARDAVLGDGHVRPKPLSVLTSMFSDRMDFLRAALDELKRVEQNRNEMTREALEDIGSMIEYFERTLRLYRQQPLNDFERRRHLERQLADLKRQRRKEQVMNWRDLLSLRSEIGTCSRKSPPSLPRCLSRARSRQVMNGEPGRVRTKCSRSSGPSPRTSPDVLCMAARLAPQQRDDITALARAAEAEALGETCGDVDILREL